MADHTFEAAASAVASKVMYAGGGTAGTGLVLSNELIGAIGLFIAFAGFCVNWYYKREHNKRAEREFALRISQFQVDPED